MEPINICRLCAKIIAEDSPQSMENVAITLNNIVPDVDLNAVTDPKICQLCITSLETCYKFKHGCIESLNKIKNALIRQESPANLEELLLANGPSSEGQKLCRLCLKCTSDWIVMEKMGTLVNKVELLKIFLQQMHIDLIKAPVICETCTSSLKFLIQFTDSCMKIEKKVQLVESVGKRNMHEVWFDNCEGVKDFIKTEEVNKDVTFDQSFKSEVDLKPELALEEEIKTESNDFRDAEIANSSLPVETASEPIFSCASCTFQSRNKFTLRRHMIVHKKPDEITMFKCSQCDFQTKYKKSIETHQVTHRTPDEITMFKCAQCPYEAKLKRNLVKHMVFDKSPLETTMFFCKTCPYKTKYRSALYFHIRMHHTSTAAILYRCDSCPFTTKLKGSLSRHAITHKSPDELVTYPCDQCSYAAKRKGRLKDHMLTHKRNEEVALFRCDLCPFSSKYKNCIAAHKTNHQDPREVPMLACELCDYETKYKSHLLRHKTRHEEMKDKVYKCSRCSFQSKIEEFQRHLAMHKSEDVVIRYKCDLCSYQAKIKSNLTKHKVVHENGDR